MTLGAWLPLPWLKQWSSTWRGWKFGTVCSTVQARMSGSCSRAACGEERGKLRLAWGCQTPRDMWTWEMRHWWGCEWMKLWTPLATSSKGRSHLALKLFFTLYVQPLDKQSSFRRRRPWRRCGDVLRVSSCKAPHQLMVCSMGAQPGRSCTRCRLGGEPRGKDLPVLQKQQIASEGNRWSSTASSWRYAEVWRSEDAAVEDGSSGNGCNTILQNVRGEQEGLLPGRC